MQRYAEIVLSSFTVEAGYRRHDNVLIRNTFFLRLIVENLLPCTAFLCRNGVVILCSVLAKSQQI